jgi:DNA replication protein DnaC
MTWDLGPEPTWLSCSCGQLSARVPCWDCSQVRSILAIDDERRSKSLASIPARFAWAKLTAPELAARVGLRDPQAVAAKVLAAAGAVFAGPSGSGKTSFAVACMRERLLGAMYLPAIRLGVARLQSKLGDGEADQVEQAIRADLLVLDDIGQEAKTATNAVRDVVFARHDAERPTWVTTGLDSRQLAELYGDGFLRRLLEGAVAPKFGGAK